MINYVWVGLLLFGFAFGIVNGKADLVSKAVINSSKTAIDICIGLLGVMCLWTGLMNIAKSSGFINALAKLVEPLISFVFPNISKKDDARGSIIMNLVANFLGLGNAATPLGIKAMKDLQKKNKDKLTATNEMSMFLVLNTAAIQLVPTTIIAIRATYGAKNPGDIILTIWFASLCSTIAGITAVKILEGLSKNK